MIQYLKFTSRFFRFRDPPSAVLEKVLSFNTVQGTVSPKDQEELRKTIQSQATISARELSVILPRISTLKINSVFPKLEPHIQKNLQEFSEEKLIGLIIILNSQPEISKHLWNEIGKTFIQKCAQGSQKMKLFCLQVLFQKCDNFIQYKEIIEKHLDPSQVLPREYGLYISILRYLQNDELLEDIAQRFEANFPKITLSHFIVPAFHLSKEGKLTQTSLELMANRLISTDLQLSPSEISRSLWIFMNSYYEFESLAPIFNKYIRDSLKSFNERELINIYHGALMKPVYVSKPLLELIYTELARKRDMKINPIDYSSVVHATQKYGFDPNPFCKYCTEEMLRKCNGGQLAIIFHSLLQVISDDTCRLFERFIIEKIDEFNNKHIINLIKDLSEKKVFNKTFWNKFEPLAKERLKEGEEMNQNLVYTQAISQMFNIKKHLREP